MSITEVGDLHDGEIELRDLFRYDTDEQVHQDLREAA